MESAEVLISPEGRPSERTEVLSAARPASGGGGRTRLRYPLPGTPDATGRRRERPAGAGTGWVVLDRWNASPLRPLLRSRLTDPRSASLAERAWNLLCHLRVFRGGGARAPSRSVRRGNGLVSRDSFLVTRDAEGFVPLPTWLERMRAPAFRRRGLVALGRMLANLVRSGTLLPELDAERIGVYVPRVLEGESSCDSAGPDPAKRRNRLPGVMVTDVSHGSLRSELSDDEVRAMLARVLEAGFTESRTPAGRGPGDARVGPCTAAPDPRAFIRCQRGHTVSDTFLRLPLNGLDYRRANGGSRRKVSDTV